MISTIAGTSDSPTITGLRLLADPGRRFEAWLDVARETGDRTLADPDSEDSVIRPIRAYAYDVGLTYRPRVRLEPLFHGGGHERGLRSGTLPVPLVVGLSRALEIASAEREREAARIGALRDRLWAGLERAVAGVSRNGPPPGPTRRISVGAA